MQDNAPKHKVKTEDEGIAVMKRSSQSPGVNPIDNIWKIIGEKAQN